ncbi:MAG: winged helix-turn-helix transcriptional regulator [Nitrospirae bacterium]|nr:winged helix-turn-helix transcriptional regulator [Nitrospirota bacterium]
MGTATLRDFILQAKAVSDETRVRILKLLDGRELCVCQLMEILGTGQSTVSKHLGILRTAGLVECRKEGTWTFYRLPEKPVNTHSLAFTRLLSSCLDGDAVIAEDRRRLKKTAGKDARTICRTAEARRGLKSKR